MTQTAIIITDDNPERLRTGLVLACAQAALGFTIRIFFQGAAVALLETPIADPDEARQSAAGLPTLAQLFEEAMAMDVKIVACQSSLALLEANADDFDPRVEWGGMVGFLGTLGSNDRLMAI